MICKVGSYTGDGAASKAITGLGFQPDLVIVKSLTSSLNAYFKTSDMPSNESFSLRQDVASQTNQIISLDSDGFSVGNGTDSNGSSVVFFYIAIKDNGYADFATFTYTGDASDGKAITGLGFQPDIVMIKSDSAVTGAFTISSETTTRGFMFFGGSNRGDLFASLDSDGLTINNGSDSGGNLINVDSTPHYGFALKTTAGFVTTFSYTGDGTDDRAITGIGFKPGFVLLKSTGTSDPLRLRSDQHSGDLSSNIDTPSSADGIQGFDLDGFEVGTDTEVNGDTQTYHGFAILGDFVTIDSAALTEDYTQPEFPGYEKGWSVNCIDFQVVTKSSNWNQDQTKRLNEYQAALNLGINYAAIGVPFDDPTKYGNYVADARTKGLKVFHRSHWNAWEGDNSADSYLGRENYLNKTYQFIIDNSSFFADGDIFTVCVEPNNANDNGNYTFRTPENSGGSFTISKFNQFIRDQVKYANNAFTEIGVSAITNLIAPSLSLVDLNGETLDSGTGGNGSGIDADFVSTYLNNVLAIDHYMSDSYSDTDSYGSKYASDLAALNTAFPGAKLFISEWGYHTTTSRSDQNQYNVYRDVVDALVANTSVVGVSFWVHMASNTTSIFTDSGGTINPHGRLCRQAIKAAFLEGNETFGRPGCTRT